MFKSLIVTCEDIYNSDILIPMTACYNSNDNILQIKFLKKAENRLL